MRIIPEGTLLVSFKLTLGRLAYAGRDLFTNEAIASLNDIDNKSATKSYLYWALTMFDWDEATKGDQKIKGKTLNKSKLKALPISLPPLQEQKRIVTILDEALESLDRLQENTEAKKAGAQELRQSILEKAFSGEFGGVGKDGWEDCSIGACCTVIAGQSPKASFYNSEGKGLPFYQGKKEFGDRFLSPATVWTTSVTKEAESGDILMSVRAPVGPVNEATEKICIGRGLAAIRAGDQLCRDFLWYALLWLQSEIRGNAGAVFDSISKSGIEALTFPGPPLDEQHRIVAILDKIFADILRLELNIQSDMDDLSDLRQSLLQKAFAGELTS